MFISTRCTACVAIAAILTAAIANGQEYRFAASDSGPWNARSASGSYLAGPYSYDDGASENAIGINCGQPSCNPPDATIVWAQYYDTWTAAGLAADTITQVEVAFGHPPGPSAPPAGTLYEIMIYDDPNDDGDPTDLTSNDLLVFGLNSSTSPDTDTLEQTAIAPAVVHGGFFVAIAMRQTMSTYPASGVGEYPAALDQSQPSLSRAWVAGTIPAANWSAFAPQVVDIPWTDLDSTSFPGVWRLRVYGSGVAPSTFCTAKSGLVCGTPAISSAGEPDITASSGFVVSAGPARSCRSGILLYNLALAPSPIPFLGGTLCIDPMGIRRAGPTNSGGTPGASSCDGEFSIDMNAFAQSGWTVPDCAGAPAGIPQANPAAFLSTPGAQVHLQFWGRDSIATGSFISDGLQYTVRVGPPKAACADVKLPKGKVTVTVCAQDANSAVEEALLTLAPAGTCAGTCGPIWPTCTMISVSMSGKGTYAELTPTAPCIAPNKKWSVTLDYKNATVDCACR